MGATQYRNPPQTHRKPTTNQPGEYLSFEIIESKRPDPMEAAIVRITCKAIDRTGDIAGALAVQTLKLAGAVLVALFWIVHTGLKAAWTKWTKARPEWEDIVGPDNKPEPQQGDGRTIIINHHHHYNF